MHVILNILQIVSVGLSVAMPSSTRNITACTSLPVSARARRHQSRPSISPPRRHYLYQLEPVNIRQRRQDHHLDVTTGIRPSTFSRAVNITVKTSQPVSARQYMSAPSISPSIHHNQNQPVKLLSAPSISSLRHHCYWQPFTVSVCPSLLVSALHC